ncbi:MAG TPA: hypothetical protein VGF50_13075 [Caulobacteraceae bacterium]
MPSPADIEAPPAAGAPVGASTQDEVFVRALDLPTLSLRQARAAVAQQLDILSPLPPAEVVASVVLVGPTDRGLNRYAVGLAPRRRIADAPGDDGAVTLIGRLDGQVIAFRFPRPREGAGAGSWVEIGTLAAACLAILLAGANLRIDREIDAVQARIDAADALVQQRSHEAAAIARVAGAWRAAAATRKAGLVNCALAGAARASGGPVTISGLALAGGELRLRLAEPPSDGVVAALRAFGLTPAVSPPAVPAAAGAGEPAAAPVIAPQTFRTSAADCR